MEKEMDFNIRYDASQSRRGAFRASVPGVFVILPSGARCPVKDLSVGGAGFACPEGADRPEQGSEIVVQLMVADKLYISDLAVRVVRVAEHGMVACAFAQPTRNQEFRLDKLVLEMQKRSIALRKAKEATDARSSAGQNNDADIKPIVLDVP